MFTATELELIRECALAVFVSIAVTTLIFWAYSAIKPIRDIVLPGQDEAVNGEKFLKEFFSASDKENLPLSKTELTGMIFLGLCIRGASRILAMAMIFVAILWAFSPLAASMV